jgi:hypothetical protein
VHHFDETWKNKKTLMIDCKKIKANYLILILSFLFNSCSGQISESIQVKITKIHKDSITLKAESQPEEIA